LKTVNFSQEQKAAILLATLGEDAIAPALQSVDESRSKKIRNLITEFNESPYEPAQVEEVIQDFERYFKFAIQAAGADSFWTRFVKDQEELEESKSENGDANAESNSAAEFEMEYEDTSSESGEPQPRFRIFQPTDDAIADLNRLHPIQSATALKTEQPKTIALVLNCLPPAKTADVVELLPEELQSPVIENMLANHSASETLLNRIVRATVEKGLAIETPEVVAPDTDDKVAGVLRELPRNIRSKMVQNLAESDPETAERIQKLLYVFDDLMKYDDRSIQKILGEVDKAQLMNALQDAEEDLKNKLLNNLSKRARDTLMEELEFHPNQPDQIVDEARSSIAEIIAKLDAADQISMD